MPGLNGNINRRILPVGLNGPIIQADSTGDNLLDYSGNDINQITIEGELEKLATNIGMGRNFSGIHYRTDEVQGNLLGEAIAIEYMKDLLSSWVTNNLDDTPTKLRLKKFNGEVIHIEPRVCKNKN